nr:NAD(P)H-dependent oxidoreductase [uncultured Desulfobulbus sp.]
MSTPLRKKLLVLYHSQGGTMQRMAQRFALGAGHEEEVETICKPAAEAGLEDLLQCRGIAIGSPEYFGTMAGMIKDFFDRTYEDAREKTIGLPYVLFVCAGNDGRGAITQIERIAAGYKWRQALEHLRVVGEPTEEDMANIEELGHTMAAGVGMGIF